MYIVYISLNLEIFYSHIGSWVIMVESSHLLMFRGMLSFISGKSFSFHKIEDLTEGKASTCVFNITYQYLASYTNHELKLRIHLTKVNSQF